MTRLTHERVNGIKTGYWSPAKKEELVQRLAAYEDTGLEPEEIMDVRMLTGWTPCDEKLPAEPEPGMQDMDELPEYIVTIGGCGAGNRAVLCGGRRVVPGRRLLPRGCLDAASRSV